MNNEKTIIFKSKKHKVFYEEYLTRCRYVDVYHKALVYCLGIDNDTRNHVDSIYDFKSGIVKTDCLNQDWITSGSAKIVRMAFNLYCDGTPSIKNHENLEDQVRECRRYSAGNLFCCGYAPYFWEAIQIRYPEYCTNTY